MKLFMQKTLIVMLAVIITSLFVKGIIQVGDTTITQETSKNYNGYFSLVDEQTIINAGFDSIQYVESQYGTGYSLYIADISIEEPLEIAINFTKPYVLLNEDTGQVHLIVGLNILRFYYQEWQLNIQYMLPDGTNFTNTDGYAYLRILGISNYEVQP